VAGVNGHCYGGRTTIKSITRQEPGPARLKRTAEADGLVAEAVHYGGENSPSAGQRLAPLRELIDGRLLDALLERSRDEAGGLRLTGEGSMLGELVKAVLEQAPEAGLTAPLGHAWPDRPVIVPAIHEMARPARRYRPRSGRCRSRCPGTGLLVPKRSGRISGGLGDMIISLDAHGMSVRDIRHHRRQVSGPGLSHETVSRITDAALEEARAWQSRPLDPVYAVVFPAAIMVKVRDNHVVQSKPAYLAAGIDSDGEKHVLGNRKTRRPVRAPHRRTTHHGMARSTQRTRHRLPGTNQVKKRKSGQD
jgi:putative transposase